MDAFEGLKEEFNIDEVEEKVEETSEKIEAIAENIAKQKYNLEDKEYLKLELQDLIASDREVMNVLKDECTAGAGPQLLMAYTALSKSVRENIAKLMDLEKQITDYQVTESNEEFREKVLESKERAAERRLSAAQRALPGTTGQLTQNNTYIFNAKDQFKALTESERVEVKVDEPKFDLS